MACLHSLFLHVCLHSVFLPCVHSMIESFLGFETLNQLELPTRRTLGREEIRGRRLGETALHDTILHLSVSLLESRGQRIGSKRLPVTKNNNNLVNLKIQFAST